MIVFNKHLLLPILLIFLLALPFTGCQKHYPVADKLSQAEIYMNEEPEAALRVLESIGQPDLHTKEHHARYALLYSQALDKNYIDKTNDSLINVAVDYYRQTDEVRSKFLSYYYKGRIHRNAGENPEAMLAFMEAEQLVDALGDDYYAGMLYQYIASIYRSYMDYPKAMEYAEQSIDCYTRAGKNRHRLWALMEKSSLFRNMNEDAESIRLMEALLPEVEATNDLELFSGCLSELILGCMDENRLADARKYYDRYVQKINPMTKNTTLLARIAQLYAYEGSFSEAQRFMEAAWEKANDRADSIILYVTSSLIHRKKGNDRQAYADLEKGVTLQNKDVRKTLQQPILTTQMDFLRQELAFQHYKQRTEKVIWMLGIGLVVTLAGIAIYGIRKRMRQRVLRIQEEKARLEEDLEVLQTTQEKTEALKNGLFESKMKELDKLVLVSLKEFKNEESRNRAILKLVQDTKDQIHGNKKNMANLEKWVNEYKDNVMQHLRSEIVLPDESYYELACYLLANFSVNTIALLMDETTNTIYKRRSRIRLLIQDSSAWHKEQFQQI